MRASRLRLSPAKTEVMWLGSYQQLKQVDIDDISILSMQVKVAETACDLGVVLDSQLSLLSNWILSPPTTTSSCSINDNHRRQNSSPGVYPLSSGLLELHAVQHVRRARFSPSRMQPHIWSQELNDATTSCRCCFSCIGCLSVNESSTRLHAWYTSLWLIRHPHT